MDESQSSTSQRASIVPPAHCSHRVHVYCSEQEALGLLAIYPAASAMAP